jgi:hypothetical protein
MHSNCEYDGTSSSRHLACSESLSSRPRWTQHEHAQQCCTAVAVALRLHRTVVACLISVHCAGFTQQLGSFQGHEKTFSTAIVYNTCCMFCCPSLCRCGRAPDDISSIVLVEQDRCFIKSEAVLRIALRLGMPLPLLAGLALLVPKFISDPVYDQVRLAGKPCRIGLQERRTMPFALHCSC